jgi:3-dehydroquinate synthase/2-deoxy-scyllo-inosose synthase
MTVMQSRNIQFGEHRYPFHFGVECTDEIAERILEIDADKYVLVVDSIVAELHLRPLLERLREKADVLVIPLVASERSKSLDVVGSILETAFASGMTRRSCVLAMGGGVVGNMAGLAAALAFRGVKLVHLPTTLIAALDSVLSMKQAVNGHLGKNLIGTFYEPHQVLVDLGWLTTLPVREMRSGLCELIKNVLAIAPETHDVLEPALRLDCRLSAHELVPLVDIAIDAKAKVMHDDSRERKKGLALEYGHTIGHALELAAPGLLSHGEAVGVGMLCAAEIATRAYALSERDLETHRRLLGKVGITKSIASTIDPNKVYDLLRFDNKRGYIRPGADELPMILLDRIGEVRTYGGTPLTPVALSEVARVLSGFSISTTSRAA